VICFDNLNFVGSIADRKRDGLFILFDNTDQHGLLECSPGSKSPLCLKKNVNDVFVTTKGNLATTYIEGRRQERAFSSQFAGRRAVDQRVA
jgi:hypothetical protein